MKLILEKLGRIEHAELDIRPLTVLVGENNTNKTWAAYCLYGLARQLILSSFSGLDQPVLLLDPAAAANTIEEAIRRVVEQIPQGVGLAKFSVSRSDLVSAVRDPVTFHLSAERIRGLLRADVSPEAGAAMRVSAAELTGESSSAEFAVNWASRSAKVEFAGAGVPFSFAVQALPSAGPEAWSGLFSEVLTRLAHACMGRSILWLLPAERKALVQTYKLLLGLAGMPSGPRSFGQIGAAPNLEPFLSAPVIDFLRVLGLLEQSFEDQRPPGAFAEALDHLEGGVLGGRVDFERVGEAVRLSYAAGAGVQLPMHTASSIVRSLAGLDIYLRYYAQAGDLLIIDEPEMNAHPEAQLRLTELLAYLVNRGIRVVITTHSPYIVDHLNNLIRAADLSQGDRAEVAAHFKLGTAECFLDADKVAAYLFKAEEGEGAPVTVTSIFDRDERHLIDWETFGRTTEYVTNVYSSEILCRLYRDRPGGE